MSVDKDACEILQISISSWKLSTNKNESDIGICFMCKIIAFNLKIEHFSANEECIMWNGNYFVDFRKCFSKKLWQDYASDEKMSIANLCACKNL